MWCHPISEQESWLFFQGTIKWQNDGAAVFTYPDTGSAQWKPGSVMSSYLDYLTTVPREIIVTEELDFKLDNATELVFAGSLDNSGSV